MGEKRNSLCGTLKIREYWGLWILLFCEICFLIFLAIYGNKLFLQWNDNLDSNMALNKIFRENQFWRDRETPVPILGGIDRSILNSGYNLTSMVYYIFDTQMAFWACYILAVAFSGGGCFLLGSSIKKFTQMKVNPNIFCVCGIIYVFLGMWPEAILGFSLIPWWVWLLVETYKTDKKFLSVIFFVLVFNISTPMIGVFIIFYTVIFCFGVMVKEKRINKTLLTDIGVIVLSVAVIDRNLLSFLAKGSAGTIKGLAQGNAYTDSIIQCVKKLKDPLLFEGPFYHTGLCVLRYVALPLILIFFFLFNIEYRNVKANKNFVITYDSLIAVLFINACAYAFDQCYYVRMLIPFASGFSFKRFLWLSSFVAMMCIAMICHYLLEKKRVRSAILILMAIPLSVILDPKYSTINSMYNMLYANYSAGIKGELPTNYWRWNEFYAEDLFEEIKSDLAYDGEWSVAYGLDPAVLQYNGIRTLDGYYSNYPSEYKEKWEELIAPVLKESKWAEEYWRESNGIRAYIYSTEWEEPGSLGIRYIDSADMLVDVTVLKELKGEYVFSVVEITNADGLGLKQIGEWSDGRDIYNVRVYALE